MKAQLLRWRRLVTPGHALAAAAMAVVVYQVWGRVFVPGGTGSNVVLGLLVAIAAVYVGATHFGPSIDDFILPKANRALRKRSRAAEGAADDIAKVVKDERKKKPRKRKVTDAQALALDAVSAKLRAAAAGTDLIAVDTAITEADTLVQQVFGTQKASAAFLAQARSLGLAFGVAVALRLFLIAPFQIPSGSMIPTLLIGDHLFVVRAMYGLMSPFGEQPSYLLRWAIPQPGDVIVFEAPPWVPRNAGEDWIKRVIAGPGQRVKRIEQTVHVDGKPYTQLGEGKLMRYMDFEEFSGGRGRWRELRATYRQEEIPGKIHDSYVDIPPVTADWPNASDPRPDQRGLSCNAEECTVKEGFVFVMGDNRDHSSDGRFWGAVPVDNVKGKALFIWVSVDGSRESVHVGDFTLPAFRWGRLGQWIR